ncbi:unnamed protein product [Calypogeia fissa]
MDYVELIFAKILANVKGHEAGRFTKGPAFTSFPHPTIIVTSSDCGPSGSTLRIDYTQEGASLFPSLSWTPLPDTQEYMLVVQDVDAPIPNPIGHGVFYGIPASKTSVNDGDFEPIKGTRKKPQGTHLTGGFKRGANFRGTVYDGPRALKGHGPHRYFFMVVALGEKLDDSQLSAVPRRKELAKELQGKVLGWGEWMGVSERKWRISDGTEEGEGEHRD